MAGISGTIYSGPGKVVLAVGVTPTLYAFQAEGENGAVKLAIAEKRTRRSQAVHGYIRSTLDDQTAELTFTPFDSWASLPGLFPTYLGIQTGGVTTSSLVIGTRPHDYTAPAANGAGPTKVWTPDGRLYNVVRSAITKHPNMKLGVGQPLYESCTITGLALITQDLGGSGSIIAGNAITETAASDPDTAGFAVDFVNGHWTGAWGAIGGFTALEVEDYWTVQVDAKYSRLTVQKRTVHMKLDSVEIMIKGRLVGQTHTQLAGKVLAHTLGGTLKEGSATDLVLTGPSSKTVTLKDCEVFMDNQGFEFGGTKLGTGEVAFVSNIDFTTGAPGPALIFSS